MAGIRYKGQIFSGAASFGSADDVAYDNTQSGLTASNVQGALDELDSNKADLNASYFHTTNPSYCKMPDGTLIQWGRVKITTGTGSAPLGYTGSATVSFPIPFKNKAIPVVITSPEENAGYWNSSVSYNGIGYTQCTIMLAGDQSSTERQVLWMAIGCWK